MLLQPRQPPPRTGIDLRCCSCADPAFLADAEGAELCIADPPWSYRGVVESGSVPEDHYDCLPTSTIAEHLAAIPAPTFAVWCTWPLLGEWSTVAGALPPYRSGGSWSKSGPGDAGHFGPGYWWAGSSELVLVYSRGGQGADRSVPVRNSWVEPPGPHSRKPAAWMAQWIRRWTSPGALVVDPYAGLGSVAEAVMLAGEGRRYLGAEIDPERHLSALSLLAQVRA